MFHDKAKRTQQGNLLDPDKPRQWPYCENFHPLSKYSQILFCVLFKNKKNCFGILKLSGRWQANKDKCYSYGLVGWAVGSLPATENDDWNKFLFKKKFWYFAGSILVLLTLCQHQINISIIFTLLTLVVGRSVDYLQTSSSTFWQISRLAQQGEVLLKLSHIRTLRNLSSISFLDFPL